MSSSYTTLRGTEHRVRAQKRRALATTSAVAILASAFPVWQSAYAQSPAPQAAQAPAVEEIIVTGTHVVRDGYEAPTPVAVIGVEALQNQAGGDITDSLTQLPTVAGGRPNVLNVGTNTGEAGLATLSFRDLGPGGGTGFVDGPRAVG